MTGLLLVAAIALAALWIVVMYNRLVRQRNQVSNGWRQIEDCKKPEACNATLGKCE